MVQRSYARPRRSPRRPQKKSGNTGLVVGGVAGGLVLILLIAVLASGGPAPEPEPAPVVEKEKPAPVIEVADKPAPEPEPEPRPDPRELAAQKILAEARKFAKDHADDPAAVVKWCRDRYFDVEGTSVEKEFKAILDAATLRADALAMAARIDKLLSQVGKLRDGDPGFEKRPEAGKLLDEAGRLAKKFADEKKDDVEKARREYHDAWEKAAGDAVRVIAKDARELAAEEKFARALGRLDDLADPFTDAPAAKELDKVRKEIEALQAAAKKKKKESDAELEKYVGTYTGGNGQFNVTLEVTVSDGKLTASISGPMSASFPLEHQGGDKFSASGQGQSASLEFNVSGDQAESVDVAAMGQSITLTRQ